MTENWNYLLIAHQHMKTRYTDIKPGVKNPAFTLRERERDNEKITCYDVWLWRYKLTLWSVEINVVSWISANVIVMKKILILQDGFGAYQMYIKIIPNNATIYEVIEMTNTWIRLKKDSNIWNKLGSGIKGKTYL